MHAVTVFAILAFGPFAGVTAQERSRPQQALRLAEFVGEWTGDVVFKVPGSQGLLLVGTVSIEQASQGTISSQFSHSGQSFSLTLEYDPTQENYLLTYESDLFPAFERLPLTYSDEKGLSAKGEITVHGDNRTLEATIEALKEVGYSGYVWRFVVLDNDREEYYNKLTFARKES